MALPKRPTSLKSNAGNLSQVRQWTAIQVADWMKEANDGLFAPYTDNILQLKINGADLMNLTQTDMKTKLGITTPNHITTLSASIERLKKKSRRSKKHRNKSPASPYEDTQNSSKSKAGISFNDIPDLATNNNKRQSAILPTSKTSLTNQHSSSSSINGLNLTSLTSLNDDMQKQKKPGHVNKAKSMFIQSNGILNENGGDYEYVNLRNENTKNGNHKNGNNKNKKKNGNKMPANKLYRAYTVQIQKDNDDQKTKHDTAQLKRVLTEQNLANKKKDKYLYKDLGKKLWPNETSKIIKEGWMKKRGVRRSGFKERWCVLRDNGHLYYFEKRPSVDSDLPQGMLDLENAIKVEYVEDDDPNTFNIKTKDRDWIFSAMSGGQLVEWMSLLNKTMEAVHQ